MKGPLFREMKKVRSVCRGIILDITEHKKAEEALLQMVEIRKKEIHHRIKNNLQVISTLLYLESGNFSDEKVIELSGKASTGSNPWLLSTKSSTSPKT